VGGLCSTPFGITEFITADPSDLGQYKIMCSTPFGITEFITAFGELRVIPERFRRDFEHRVIWTVSRRELHDISSFPFEPIDS
jgi:hypothetical protein